MKIRSYKPDDAEALADLYVRSVHHYGPRCYTAAQVAAWASTASASRIGERNLNGRFVAVAVDDSGMILGWGDLEADGHLDFLYAAPEAEGLSVGSALYRTLEDEARARGIARIFVEASELAKPLFVRNGFRLLRRNSLTIGEIAIYNYSMEKDLVD
jgi:putative acetyltransferase